MGGYGGYEVCNIFSLRSTDPRQLYAAADPVGPDNDAAIVARAKACDRVICGWGNHGRLNGRGEQILAMLLQAGIEPECLRLTKAGQPGHPLYIGYAVQPVAFEPLRKR